MAFVTCCGNHVSSDGKHEMTIQEFKKWLKRFDADKDNRISQEELREAVRYNGGWFSTRKSRNGIKSADQNGNGFIDNTEINRLAEFAQKHLGVRIVA